ncbi:cytochrome-c peroxidase [Taibaiella lutea]|uniref:Cytochrome-c peroxidase n=1 Tax=Taibaiella lutea TaxID=2608001 RepID=A0A5M6CIG9_9BACT|nr:cytochrome c peroxidase [Taibaiella lutea]KAA5534904.1 cytochrome-c peroxidase [Taibaiella lutea]
MKIKSIIIFTLCVSMLIVAACHKDAPEKVEIPFQGFETPSNFPAPAYHFETNEITKAGFELGRKLFYDPILSRNNTISCGSCHIQSAGFTHHGHDISHGIDDRLGKRNAPAIMNLAWSKSFMADGGIFDLDLQPIAPITTFEEMDETMQHVIEKLQQHKDYPALFQNAFGSSTITSANFLKALSQFMLMCISSNSKYDSIMRNEGPAFTAAEQEGYSIYKQKCSQCHTEPLFSDNSFRNNGIGIGYNGDVGRYAVTLDEADKYKFKVPSLRNLQYTSPYMHDGRFYTLDAVLDQYVNHVTAMPTLDSLLQQNNVYGIPLTMDEKTKILAFLNTLNDKHFVTNPILAEQ